MVFVVIVIVICVLALMYFGFKSFVTETFCRIAQDFHLDFDPHGDSLKGYLPMLQASEVLNRTALFDPTMNTYSVSRVISADKPQGTLSAFLLSVGRRRRQRGDHSCTFEFRLAAIFSSSVQSMPFANLHPDGPFSGASSRTYFPVRGLANYHCLTESQAESFAAILTPGMVNALENMRLYIESRGKDVLIYRQQYGLYNIFGVRKFWQTVDSLADEFGKQTVHSQ
jgi:hypothetical protein